MNARAKSTAITAHQSFLKDLYGESNRERSSDYLFGYLCRSAAYLGKNVFLKKQEDQHFLRTISWLLAIANYFGLDAQLCLFSRFPTICPYCLTSPCTCFKTNKSPVDYLPAYKIQKELKAKYKVLEHTMDEHEWSFDKGIKLLTTVYPNNEVIWHHAGPWHLFAKLQEEVGELHEAISKYEARKKPIQPVGEEIADTLAWLLGAWGIVYPDRSLDEAFINYYYDNCPVCTECPCVCLDRADRAAELVDVKLLQTLEELLGKLEVLLPDASESLNELRKSVSAAAKEQSEPITVHALKNTKSTLSQLRDGLTAADDIGQRGLSIINSIIALIEKIPWLG